jgi:NADH dehydrogenase
LHVAIIGAGATGVELAAELHKTTRELLAYGLDRINPERDVKFSIVEAAPRILPALPERLSKATAELLRALNVQILTGERVTEVTATGVRTADGKLVPAELVVWAAGIKAPEFLKGIDGLETNRAHQLVVDTTLATTRDRDIFALGDCAACPWPEAGRHRWLGLARNPRTSRQRTLSARSTPHARRAAATMDLSRFRLAGFTR